MRLIVGLGDPGASYEDTPHNAGFLVCDHFASRHHLPDEIRKFHGLLRRGRIDGTDVGVLKPQTYMNLSGQSVSEALRYLPIELADLVVVWDDIDLPEGRVRIRPGGGDGGHQGTRSIIEHLGGSAFTRVRVGVGRPSERRGAAAHVLGRIRDEEKKRCFENTVRLAVDALDVILDKGVAEAMNRYNGTSASGSEEEGEE